MKMNEIQKWIISYILHIRKYYNIKAGLQGFASHGAVFYLGAGMAGHSGSPWVSQAPTFHLSEAVGQFFFYVLIIALKEVEMRP